MKKVLIVIPSLEQGGGQKVAMDLANGIDKNKFLVRVLVYYGKSNSVFDRYADEHHIDVIYLNKAIGLHLSFVADVKAVIKEYKPDIIHTHLDSMLYLLPFYKKRQLKLHTVHTLADKESRGLQRIVRFIAYKICGVVPVAISDTVACSIAAVHKIKRENIPVVYNGVDCKRYAIPKTSSGYIRLISVGAIYEVKNFSFLVDCFAEVSKKHENVFLTIVGDGALRGKIEEQAQQLGIVGKVHITGVVSDVEKYLSNADIFVASSIYEGLPISMLEAMAAGLPIISTNVGGVPDIVKNGENGLLVNSGDRDGYIQALDTLIGDEEKRRTYAERSKRLSLTFDNKNTVAGYEALYQG